MVLAEKPVIAQDTSAMDPRLLRTLLGNLSTLSSVYHLPPAVRSLGACLACWPDETKCCPLSATCRPQSPVLRTDDDHHRLTIIYFRSPEGAWLASRPEEAES